MSRKKRLYQISQWIKTIENNMDNLSKPQAKILGQWSFATVLSRHCSLSMASLVLSKYLEEPEKTVKQRLCEWYKEKTKKKGEKRQELDVEECFDPLLKWVMKNWQGDQLPLAMDATSLSDNLTILSISVLYRSIAIPVAWKVLRANVRHPWNPEWIRLFDCIRSSINDDINVLVLSDRGLYSKHIFNHIKSLNWHPFMRINLGGYFRPTNQYFLPLPFFASGPGTHWHGSGTAFKTNPLQCTLLTYWHPDYREPWLVLTDISPNLSDPAWYSLRAWIEQGFRTNKRGGLQWQNTRMTDPDRAARIWLVIAVSLLWLLSIGTQDDQYAQLEHLDIPIYNVFPPSPNRRHTSVFRRGWIKFLISLIDGISIAFSTLIPEPLPYVFWDSRVDCILCPG